VDLARFFSSVFHPSPLIAARFLRQTYSDPVNTASFEQQVRDVLYRNVTLPSHSDTMKEIRRFCAAPSKSPTLDSIITYNFDDVLESCLSSLEIEIPFTPIYSIGQ